MSGLCTLGGGLAGLLICLVLMYLLYSFALSLVLPPKRLDGVSKRRARHLIAAWFVFDEALASFNKSGRLHLRLKRYFAIGIALLFVSILAVEKICCSV